jgi:hypothetical protein
LLKESSQIANLKIFEKRKFLRKGNFCFSL